MRPDNVGKGTIDYKPLIFNKFGSKICTRK